MPELKKFHFSEIHFPEKQWSFLRTLSAESSTHHGLESAIRLPDFFLWGCQLKGQNRFWVWSQKGYSFNLESENLSNDIELPILLLGSNLSELEAYGLYLKTTFQAQAPLEVEWVHALDVLVNRIRFTPTDENLGPYISEALQASGLEPHLGVLANRFRFFFLTQEEKFFLFQKKWDPSIFELLETWPLEIRKAFVQAVLKWNLSANQTKEATNFVLIFLKKFGEKSVRAVLESNHKSQEEFRMGLMCSAQPELATLTRLRIERLRGLQIPPRTSVFGDPSFEKDGLRITHTPRNMTDYVVFKGWIESPETEAKIKELLEIYQ